MLHPACLAPKQLRDLVVAMLLGNVGRGHPRVVLNGEEREAGWEGAGSCQAEDHLLNRRPVSSKSGIEQSSAPVFVPTE